MRSTCKAIGQNSAASITMPTRRQRHTDSVMKGKQLWTVSDRYVRDFEGAEEAIERLLLHFGYCRRALIQYGESRFVQYEANNCNALLLAKAEQILPIVCGVKVVQLHQMQQSKSVQELANAIVNNGSERELRGGCT